MVALTPDEMTQLEHPLVMLTRFAILTKRSQYIVSGRLDQGGHLVTSTNHLLVMTLKCPLVGVRQ